jgi:zinc protease
MKRLVLCLVGLSCTLALAASLQAAILPKRSVLGNGMVLLTSEQRSLPIVSIQLLIDGGARYDASKQEGVANLTAKLLTYGTQRRTAVQISETLDFIGANLSSDCGNDLASVSMTVLKKDLTTGLELLAEVLTSANFPADEVERQKQSVTALLAAREEDPGYIAQRKFAELLYPGSPYGRPPEGTASSVQTIQQKSLKDFYERHYRPNRAIMAVVGDVSQTEITQAIERAFRVWRKGQPSGAPAVPGQIGSAQSSRINKDLTQANIVMGHEGVPRNNPDYYAIQVMNYILGGGDFSSRLMESIRNERGLAYSVYSYFAAEKSHGSFALIMQTKNETAQEAIRIANEEIRRLREQRVAADELNDAKNYLTGSFPLRLDTNQKVAAFLAQVEYFGLGLDYPERYPHLINKVTAEDVQRVANRYLHPEKLITVVVGALKKIGEK